MIVEAITSVGWIALIFLSLWTMCFCVNAYLLFFQKVTPGQHRPSAILLFPTILLILTSLLSIDRWPWYVYAILVLGDPIVWAIYAVPYSIFFKKGKEP